MPTVSDLLSPGAQDPNDPNSGPDMTQWDQISGPAWAPVSVSSPTPSPTPSGPTGFHLVALKCDQDCDDALEIVPSAQDSCETIAQNQPTWWGAAYPDPAETQTQDTAQQLPPFSVLQTNNFDVLYVFDDDLGFSAMLCGLPKTNFTFTSTSNGWS
jgi:hypothetical protein